MTKHYTLHTWANGFGQWFCRIEFTGSGLGNTGEAERILGNAITAAKRRIRGEIVQRNYTATKTGQPQYAGGVKRLAYAVAENKPCPCGCNRLTALTITEMNGN